MVLTQEEALRQILIRSEKGIIEVINVRGLVSETLMIDGVLFNPRNMILPSATIGGIKLEDGIISSASLSFNVANGMIDMGGASLTNVGNIVTDANDYRAVYGAIVIPATSNAIVGEIVLPSGSVVANVSIITLAISAGGLSVSQQLGYKVKRYLGVTTTMPSGYNEITTDDPIISGIDTTLVGSNPLSVTVSNPSPVSLNVRVVAAVTILAA